MKELELVIKFAFIKFILRYLKIFNFEVYFKQYVGEVAFDM